MAFAILQEQEGRRHWIRKNGPSSDTFTTAILPPSAGLIYADREAAERRIVRVPSEEQQRQWFREANGIVADERCECCNQPLGLCIGPLGLRPQTWSRKRERWVNACNSCARSANQIEDNS